MVGRREELLDLWRETSCGLEGLRANPTQDIGPNHINKLDSVYHNSNFKGFASAFYDGNVFSFVAEPAQNKFSGDLNDFIKYLTQSQGYSSSQCLYSIGAGTEPFVGSNAKFTTTGYSVSLSAGSSGNDEGSSGDSDSGS
ncbi:unnamed protein product [Clonostachys rosea]|uniref:Uncharacterized protein n=1 Tax=Bionectria ochroleuca TaxID=29856 RepID=A0ABY6UJY5_BIOOC|nr:unnamed protein product [Clonostachys rosea]